ncbi:hypothetical protein DEU56DRAFT_773027 [Suillus clintonianus]|uniref:uncharacterized protein n=1 Tax=Suillus clintonianus TaxID=1904413 RepID=UPI001B87DB26|nr:uncharacterized protein DEU56DRAFT_773027 [Suillus clintonianus]KAG2154099.1 hypothetical protein DEU56DRAFT_773027 [Suillus clintonianus]
MSVNQFKGPYDPSIMADSYAQWEQSLEIEIQRTFDTINREVLDGYMARDLARLRDPQVDPDFLCTWTGILWDRTTLSRTTIEGHRAPPGFNYLINTCLKYDLVEVMILITSRYGTFKLGMKNGHALASYCGLAVLVDLLHVGTDAERKSVAEEMMNHNIVDLCFKNIDSWLCAHRKLAASTIRSLAGLIGNRISADMVADIIAKLCVFVLQGPRIFVEQFYAPETKWQGGIIALRGQNASEAEVAKCALRYSGMAHDDALWAAQGLVCTYPVLPAKFRLEILKKRPGIIDLLLDCAITPRPAWYPERQSDAVACEILALLFQWPPYVVPGVPSPLDGSSRTQEWKALSQALKMLTARQEWSEKLIEVWMGVEEEDWRHVESLFNNVKNYGAKTLLGKRTFQLAFELRGIKRIAILRLIATLTHAADSCGITNAELESLLRVAYVASHKVQQANSENEEDHLMYAERTQDMFALQVGDSRATPQVDSPLQIAEELVMGPTALARLLAVLAQRGILDSIQTLKKAPSGLSTATSLDQVQMITHPEIIRKFLSIAFRRVESRTESGRKVTQSNPSYSRMHFMSSAELAASLVSFDRYTHGKYAEEVKGVRKQLVVALGNASEMAIRTGQTQIALSLALGAITSAENIPETEGLDEAITAKNVRRADQARATLRQG